MSGTSALRSKLRRKPPRSGRLTSLPPIRRAYHPILPWLRQPDEQAQIVAYRAHLIRVANPSGGRSTLWRGRTPWHFGVKVGRSGLLERVGSTGMTRVPSMRLR